MTAKEYLNQLRKLMLKTNNKIRQCEDIREKVMFLQGIDYSRDRVQTSPQDQLSATMATLMDLENETLGYIAEYTKTYDEAINRINQLSKREYMVILQMRYLEEDPKKRKFERIACEINYSYVRTCHMHGEALQEFEKLMQS